MRVGIMLRHIGEKGGIVTYSRNIVKSFIRLAPQHHFALFYAQARDLGAFAGPANVREHLLPSAGKLAWDQVATPRLARALDLDLIFNPKLSVPLVAHCPRILVLRPEQFVHPELFKPLDRAYFKALMPLYCRAAARVLAPTAQAARDIVRHVGADPAKTVWVHEGCGDHFFAPAPPAAELEAVRQRYGLPERYVLFVGGITPLKNFERLVQAWARVREKHPIPLVVVGFNRWRFEQDVAFARSHPAAGDIVFPGFVSDEDMPQVYRLATALFFPSIYEGFGIPIPEAFATGCPVVTTNRGCSPEVAGGGAHLVDPFDVEDMARGLARVVSEPDYRQELIARGLERAPHFHFDRCARQTLQVLEDALA